MSIRALRARLDKLGGDGPRCRQCGAGVPPDQRDRMIHIVEVDDPVEKHPDPARCPACGVEWPADVRPTIHLVLFRQRPDQRGG